MFTTASASTRAPVASQATRQGLRSPVKRGATLPPKIGSALAAINIDPRFRDLSLTARNVLMFIVQVTDVRDPLKPSWAHKETMAEYLRIGEATVYRMLNVLINHDFIERLEQERKGRNGRFAVARIRLTPTCCEALGLIQTSSSKTKKRNDNIDSISDGHGINAEDNVVISETVCMAVTGAECSAKPRATLDARLTDPASPASKMIDGHIDILPTADQQTQSTKQSRPARWQRPQPGQAFLRVPREFFWLIEEDRLTAPQVCKLMREFSTRGQRLSDAVSVLAARLRQLPKTKTFAYLAALAKSPTDFKWRRTEQARAVQAEHKQEAVRETTASLQGMAGKYLFSTKQTHLFLLRGGHAEAWWLDNGVLRRGSQPVNADFVEAYSSGRLSLISSDRGAEILALWGKLN